MLSSKKVTIRDSHKYIIFNHNHQVNTSFTLNHSPPPPPRPQKNLRKEKTTGERKGQKWLTIIPMYMPFFLKLELHLETAIEKIIFHLKTNTTRQERKSCTVGNIKEDKPSEEMFCLNFTSNPMKSQKKVPFWQSLRWWNWTIY